MLFDYSINKITILLNFNFKIDVFIHLKMEFKLCLIFFLLNIHFLFITINKSIISKAYLNFLNRFLCLIMKNF